MSGFVSLFDSNSIRFLLLNQNNQKEINGYVVRSVYSTNGQSLKVIAVPLQAVAKLHQKAIFFSLCEKKNSMSIFLWFRDTLRYSEQSRKKNT